MMTEFKETLEILYNLVMCLKFCFRGFPGIMDHIQLLVLGYSLNVVFLSVSYRVCSCRFLRCRNEST
jgi:hypothetical protein